MKVWMAVLSGFAILVTSGCALTLVKRSPWDIQQLAQLSDELEQTKSLAQLKSGEANELRHAKQLLEDKLSTEASVGYDERGLVARMVNSVLFDSGKAQLNEGAGEVLTEVAEVLREVPNLSVEIEGHTDSEPIKHSGWESNQALSVARAQAVVDYLTNMEGIKSGRLQPMGYGENRPLASNETPEGRQKNRRVEIVLQPQSVGSPNQGSRASYTK